MPIDGWDEGLKQGFWKFLAEFIGHNQAGWGTWCVRETQEPVRVGDSDKENHAPQPREVVKVYCWGEVVGEVWLLLFIGVGTKFKKIGARWVDAGGVAVVVMEGGG